MRLTPVGKIVLFLLIAGGTVGVWRLTNVGAVIGKLAPGAKERESVVPPKANLPEPAGMATPVLASRVTYQAPSTEPAFPSQHVIKYLGYAWNSQMGLHLAIGGPQTTKGSLMEKHGVNMKFERQDDNGKLQEALVAFATALKNGDSDPQTGTHFVAIMGDGTAAFLKGLNDALKRLGPQYQAKIVGSCGYSRGEDKFMGPAAWKDNPEAARGGLCAGVLRDGDWNIAQKWCGDNGIKSNPDEKTWDPDALNWVNASDYLDAPEKYIAGYSEERAVVRNGKRTGEKKRVAVDSCVTWTPGDVNVVHKKGGLVSIASTREYTYQMPNAIIGIDKWCQDHAKQVTEMLRAIGEGSTLVKTDPQALHQAAEISAQNYHEEDADYWERYYKGLSEADKEGNEVPLGGSYANDLGDMAFLFGLTPGGQNIFAATYQVFGDIVIQQYPDLVPSYYPASQVVDTRYLQAALKASGYGNQQLVKVKPSYKGGGKIVHVVSRKNWNIPFASGQATFSPQAQAVLQRLKRDLLIAGGTYVAIHGHTDNQGDANKNMQLSEQRAFAVKHWLQKVSAANFPDSRVKVFAHGQTNPVAPNTSEAGRARNRRVEIVLGTSGGV